MYKFPVAISLGSKLDSNCTTWEKIACQWAMRESSVNIQTLKTVSYIKKVLRLNVFVTMGRNYVLITILNIYELAGYVTRWAFGT